MWLASAPLVLSHFSLGRYLPFEVRVQAAASAGFDAMGCYVGDYRRLRAEGRSAADLRAVLSAFGMRIAELEALRGWSSRGVAREAYLREERLVFEMSDEIGPAATVQVIGPIEGSLDCAAEAFAGLCDRAAEHGLSAAIEFLPEMTNIPDAAAAWEIVRLAGRDNGGLCLDSWHHFRGANNDGMLRAIPPERIFTVQLNDGTMRPADPDYYTDCTHHRLPPGEGEFDLVRFLSLLEHMQVRCPLSVEVLSDDLQALEPAAAARVLAEATRGLRRRILAQPAV